MSFTSHPPAASSATASATYPGTKARDYSPIVGFARFGTLFLVFLLILFSWTSTVSASVLSIKTAADTKRSLDVSLLKHALLSVKVTGHLANVALGPDHPVSIHSPLYAMPQVYHKFDTRHVCPAVKARVPGCRVAYVRFAVADVLEPKPVPRDTGIVLFSRGPISKARTSQVLSLHDRMRNIQAFATPATLPMHVHFVLKDWGQAMRRHAPLTIDPMPRPSVPTMLYVARNKAISFVKTRRPECGCPTATLTKMACALDHHSSQVLPFAIGSTHVVTAVPVAMAFLDALSFLGSLVCMVAVFACQALVEKVAFVWRALVDYDAQVLAVKALQAQLDAANLCLAEKEHELESAEQRCMDSDRRLEAAMSTVIDYQRCKDAMMSLAQKEMGMIQQAIAHWDERTAASHAKAMEDLQAANAVAMEQAETAAKKRHEANLELVRAEYERRCAGLRQVLHEDRIQYTELRDQMERALQDQVAQLEAALVATRKDLDANRARMAQQMSAIQSDLQLARDERDQAVRKIDRDRCQFQLKILRLKQNLRRMQPH